MIIAGILDPAWIAGIPDEIPGLYGVAYLNSRVLIRHVSEEEAKASGLDDQGMRSGAIVYGIPVYTHNHPWWIGRPVQRRAIGYSEADARMHPARPAVPVASEFLCKRSVAEPPPELQVFDAHIKREPVRAMPSPTPGYCPPGSGPPHTGTVSSRTSTATETLNGRALRGALGFQAIDTPLPPIIAELGRPDSPSRRAPGLSLWGKSAVRPAQTQTEAPQIG